MRDMDGWEMSAALCVSILVSLFMPVGAIGLTFWLLILGWRAT